MEKADYSRFEPFSREIWPRIKGYGNEKDLATAMMLFREMRTEGVPYNTIAYNSIIASRLQNLEEIKETPRNTRGINQKHRKT